VKGEAMRDDRRGKRKETLRENRCAPARGGQGDVKNKADALVKSASAFCCTVKWGDRQRLLSLGSLDFLVHDNVCDEPCDDEEKASPCVPVLVCHVAHEWNERTKNEQQCAHDDEYNTEIFHCIFYFLD